jgi:hypothetical protein
MSLPRGALQAATVACVDRLCPAVTCRASLDSVRAGALPVANLRTAPGKDPHDKGLHELVGELSTRSEESRRRWNAHDVRTHGTGVKPFHHHIVGDLELAYESLDLRAEPGLTPTI